MRKEPTEQQQKPSLRLVMGGKVDSLPALINSGQQRVALIHTQHHEMSEGESDPQLTELLSSLENKVAILQYKSSTDFNTYNPATARRVKRGVSTSDTTGTNA